MKQQLRTALHHPATNLVLGLILVATSLVEVWESLTGGTVEITMSGMEMPVGTYDGLLAYGLVHVLRAIAELVEDIEHRVRD
jgi:hypothetical protein